jgi:hypothetical protein
MRRSIIWLASVLLVTAATVEKVAAQFEKPDGLVQLAEMELNDIADPKTCRDHAIAMVSSEVLHVNEATRSALLDALDTARDKLTGKLPDEQGVESRDGLVKVTDLYARLGDMEEARNTFELADTYNFLLPKQEKAIFEYQKAWLGAILDNMDAGLDVIAKLPARDRNGAYWAVMQHLHATRGDLAVSEKILGRMTPEWVTDWARLNLIKTYAARGNDAAAERLLAAIAEADKHATAINSLAIGQSLAKNWTGYAKTIDRLPPKSQAMQLPHLARHYLLTGDRAAADKVIAKARELTADLQGADQRNAINVLIDYDCLSGDFKDAAEWLAKIADTDGAKVHRRLQIVRAQAIKGDTAPARELLATATASYHRAHLLSSLAAAGGPEADKLRRQARDEAAKLFSDPTDLLGRASVMESLVVAGQLDTLQEWIKTLPDPVSRRIAFYSAGSALRRQQEFLTP